MKDFYFELFDLISKESEWKPEIRNILSDMVVLGESLAKRNWSGEDDIAGNFYPFMGLTYNAYQFSLILRRRLPDNLHSRIVLGEQNEWTRAYIENF